MKKIILASSSPRRRELLSRYGLEIEIVKAEIQEVVDYERLPEEIAMALAFEKAYNISRNYPDNIVIAADTIVAKDGKILGKPKDEEEAYNTLSILNGDYHYVITGICIIEENKGLKIIDYEKTKVKFRELPERYIKNYIKTKEPMDKAGAYGIQGIGEILVEEIKGSYSNVVGLPIGKVDYILNKFFDFNIL